MQYNFGYFGYEDDPDPKPEPEPPIIVSPYPYCGTLTIVGPEDDDPRC